MPKRFGDHSSRGSTSYSSVHQLFFPVSSINGSLRISGAWCTWFVGIRIDWDDVDSESKNFHYLMREADSNCEVDDIFIESKA